jgi:hypothetical protein
MLIEDNRTFGYNNPDMSRIQEILIKQFSSGVTDACGSSARLKTNRVKHLTSHAA